MGSPLRPPGFGATFPIVLDGLDPACRPDRIRLERVPGRFRLDPALACLTAARFEELRAARGATLFDGPMVRLAGIERRAGDVAIRWQETGFFDYARSNLLLGEDAPGGAELADALGMTLLLETSDGRLVVQRRAPGVLVHPGKWGPSAAGALEPGDLRGAATLAELRPWREAAEELGVAPVPGSAVFLGLGRERGRGRAPELFFRGRLDLSAEGVEAALARAPDRGELDGLVFLDLRSIADWRDAVAGRATPTLVTGLTLLERQMLLTLASNT